MRQQARIGITARHALIALGITTTIAVGLASGQAAPGGTATGATTKRPWACVNLQPNRSNGTPDQSPFGAGVYLEQDGVLPWLSPWNEDRNYTMGLAFPLMGQWVHSAHLDLPLQLVDCLTSLNRRHNQRIQAGDTMQDFGLVLGHTAFTPDNLNTAQPIRDDRPYASLLFLSSYRTTMNAASRSVFRTEFTIGVLGLGIAESVQTRIHIENRRRSGKVTPYDPLGWHNQISHGGEPTAKYTVSVAKAATESMWHDLAATAEASAGYYTSAAAGATLRLGYIRSPFWALSTNPLTAANQRARDASAAATAQAKPSLDERRAGRRFELLAFGSTRARLVGYNVLLQGQFRHSTVTMDATQIANMVLEGEAGASLGVGPCSFVVTIARRSPEFRVGIPRAHTFGGAHLVCTGKRGRSDGEE